MKYRFKNKSSFLPWISWAFIVILLLWHLASFTFLFQGSFEKERISWISKIGHFPNSEQDQSEIPFEKAAEGSAENEVGSASEYEKHDQEAIQLLTGSSVDHHHYASDKYSPFSGELLSPPPEIS
jgi:hypothetical protein